MKKIETSDSIYFRGKSNFEDNDTQNWLVFQPIQRYFKRVSANNNNILSCKSKRLSDESITFPTTSNKMLNTWLDFVRTRVRVKFNGDCLKPEKITFNHGKLVNLYITYRIERRVNMNQLSNTRQFFFSAVKLIKHVNVDMYNYSGYGFGFDRKGSYSIGN